MKTKLLTGEATIGKNIELTTLELHQMSEMLGKIEQVIDSHLKEDKKKIYLNDDDLFRLEAIFMCILETEHNCATSVFDEYVKTRKKMLDVEDIEHHFIDADVEAHRRPQDV